MVRPNILIVDDEEQYCTVISDLLKSYGCDVHVANDAGDALFRLKSSIPDLILMDIMMPEIDGLTLIGRLRLMDEWSKIPIIAISAKTQPADRMAAIGAGANSFLPKPFTTDMLKGALREYVPVPVC